MVFGDEERIFVQLKHGQIGRVSFYTSCDSNAGLRSSLGKNPWSKGASIDPL